MTSLQAASTVLIQVWDPQSCAVCNPHSEYCSCTLIAHLNSPRSLPRPHLAFSPRAMYSVLMDKVMTHQLQTSPTPYLQARNGSRLPDNQVCTGT